MWQLHSRSEAAGKIMWSQRRDIRFLQCHRYAWLPTDTSVLAPPEVPEDAALCTGMRTDTDPPPPLYYRDEFLEGARDAIQATLGLVGSGDYEKLKGLVSAKVGGAEEEVGQRRRWGSDPTAILPPVPRGPGVAPIAEGGGSRRFPFAWGREGCGTAPGVSRDGSFSTLLLGQGIHEVSQGACIERPCRADPQPHPLPHCCHVLLLSHISHSCCRLRLTAVIQVAFASMQSFSTSSGRPPSGRASCAPSSLPPACQTAVGLTYSCCMHSSSTSSERPPSGCAASRGWS